MYENSITDIINAQKGNKDAMEKLVKQNSGLIYSIVKRFIGRGYDAEDLYQIGCIGFTTVYIPNWEQEANIKGLEFLDIVKQYAKYEKELKDKCDFIIVCYHGGFEKTG